MGGSFLHPFLVGVTSFGKGCETTTPGVYVRVAEYIDWIQHTTGISFDTHECVSRYTKYREFAKEDLINTDPRPLDYIAQIGWSISMTRVEWNCSGTFIHHLYVLTSASCLMSKR